MNWRCVYVTGYLLLVAFFMAGCVADKKKQTLSAEDSAGVSAGMGVEEKAAPEAPQYPPGVSRLMSAYPEQIAGYDSSTGELIMAGGDRILYDDGRQKSFDEKLDNSDPEDMFSMPYTITGDKPAYLADAGRSRCERLFKSMYGSSEAEVRKNLTSVDWLGHKVLFTKVNGADKALRAVAAEVAADPQLAAIATGPSSFYWRKVRGANRQSAHSYGIAIDVGVANSNYWLWDNPGAGETARIAYKNKMPAELVKAFERHGFIWGGNWYHYDTMHFEYRPEILEK